MKKINPTETLNQKILLLEQKKIVEFESLHLQYLVLYESVKPINLMKSALNKMTSTPDLKHNVVNTIIGLSAGYISKKLVLGSTHNPVKRILGTVLQFAITNLVARRSETLK